MDCPGGEALEEWLAGNGDPGLDGHVGRCATCQRRLDELTRGGELAPGFVAMREPVALPVMAWSRAAASRAGQARAARPDGSLPAGSRIAHFEIIAELGRGSSGTVYKARDTVLDREVAIKVFRGGDIARINAEARRMASVGHPAIVPILSVIDRASHLPPAIAMELVAGESLAQRIGREGPLPCVEAAELLVRVASGVEAAHAAGLVHRDIKPGNILLDSRNDRVLLADFGLAVDSGAGNEPPGGGTPGFIAPERIGSLVPASPSADIYSLGATLYQALTGTPPYRGAARQALDQALADDPAPIRGLNRAVPRDLETIVHKAMARKPSARYGSVREFADDLARWLSDKPIIARPPGPFGRAVLWIRRHARVAAFALVTGSLLVALAAVSLAFAWKSSSDAAALRAENARARGNLSTALDAVTRMASMARDESARWPGASPMRGKLTEWVGESLDSLAVANLGEPGLSQAAARAAIGLAEFLAQTGETGRAIGILEQVAARDEDDPVVASFARIAQVHLSGHSLRLADYDKCLEICRRVARAEGSTLVGAQARTNAAKALRLQGKYLEAMEEFTAAGIILGTLSPGPFIESARYVLHGELAAMALSRGRLDDALAEAREMLKHAVKSRPAAPDEPFTPVEETRARLMLASILLKLGRVDESEREAKAAGESIGPAVAADPRRLDWRQLLVEALMARGDCLWNTGDFPKALEVYEPARLAATDLIKTDPGNAQFRMQAIFLAGRVAEMRARRMEFARCRDDVREMIGLFEAFKGKIPERIFKRDLEALELDLAVVDRFSKFDMEDPSLPDVDNPDISRKIRTGRVLSLARMGRWDACGRFLAEEIPVKERKPAEYLQLARACALLSRQDERKAAMAIDFLKKAVAGNPDLRISSISDPEFIPLRPLPGFQAIVQLKP